MHSFTARIKGLEVSESVGKSESIQKHILGFGLFKEFVDNKKI